MSSLYLDLRSRHSKLKKFPFPIVHRKNPGKFMSSLFTTCALDSANRQRQT